MQAYAELVPPTAVTHAVSIPFTTPRTPNLIVAKTSLLQIFETRTTRNISAAQDDDTSPSSAQVAFSQSSQVQDLQTKLVLVGEYPLSGTVTSLASVKALNTKTGGEALLVAFKSAKISLIEWDPEVHNISTISIHYYEGGELQGSPWTPDLSQCSTFLTVDPSSRCAALKFGVRRLAILPFRQLGDDLVMGDYDPDLDEAPPQQQTGSIQNANSQAGGTPYSASFVLTLTALDPNLIYPVDLAFLYEYREPTIGILSSSKYPSASLIAERKDILSYMVFTLDLEQRARTPLLSVSGLPFDLFKVVPLPLPVGGSLLIGPNCLVHVDQAGKTNAVAVNEFSKMTTNFSMADQSSLNLKLEGCVVHTLDRQTGDALLVLNTGEFVILKFKLDGRSVSGLLLQKVSGERGGLLLKGQASCVVSVGAGKFFVGSEEADSILIGTREKQLQLTRKRSHAEMLGTERDGSEDDLEDEEDDLYGSEEPNIKRRASSLSGPGAMDEVTFSIQDRLPNFTPVGSPVSGKLTLKTPPASETSLMNYSSEVDLVIPVCRGRSGGLAFFNRRIRPRIRQNLEHQDIGRAWSVRINRDSTTRDYNDELTTERERLYDNVLVTSNRATSTRQSSAVYSIDSNGIKIQEGADFELDTLTLNVGTLNRGTRLVQVSNGELRCYDPDFGLVQILPMEDENTGAELQILHTSFCDPYLLVIRNDASAIILQIEQSGDLDEMERSGTFLNQKWQSGCIHQSGDISTAPLVYLLNSDGALCIFDISNLSLPVYVAEGLPFLPPILSTEHTARRSAARETIAEILVADIGDLNYQSPHLIVRTKGNDVTVYRPFKTSMAENDPLLSQSLKWLKLTTYHHPASSQDISNILDPEEPDYEEEIKGSMRVIQDLQGYNAVFVPTQPPALVIKEASTSAKVLTMGDSEISFIDSIHCELCAHGCILVDNAGRMSLASTSNDTRFGDTGWAVHEVKFDHEVSTVAFHPDTGLYIIGTRNVTEFKLPEDDWHQEWAREQLPLKPIVDHDVIKVWDPEHSSVIQNIPMQEDESIMCLQTLNLVVSEVTNERKNLIAVGTSIVRGEDLPCNSSIYIYEIITVVPEPDRPETNKALKLIVKEDVRGPVTAISEIGTEGFLVAAQGQKCMVRGLKEDNSLLPVAFMDMQCYATSFKTLKNTGLLLVGDVQKGIWFTGFSVNPYRMRLFGKSKTHMEVISAEFLPDNKQLFILTTDPDCNLQVLEFNPEAKDPKSLSGQRLVERSSFHTGHFPSSMKLLSSTVSDSASWHGQANGMSNGDADGDTPMSDAHPTKTMKHYVLMASLSGAMALVTSLSEDVYRQLGALQTHLTSVLDHPCGLNPRSYRSVENEGVGGRGVLDGNLLKRWWELGVQRRSEAATRVGASVEELKEALDLIVGRNLEYF